MFSYKPLWDFMEKNNVSQYKLMKEGIASSTLTRLRRNQPVSIETIDKLCSILGCRMEDLVEHVEDIQ